MMIGIMGEREGNRSFVVLFSAQGVSVAHVCSQAHVQLCAGLGVKFGMKKVRIVPLLKIIQQVKQ